MITFGSDFGDKDLAVASTSIRTAEGEHQLSIVGPTRMKYAEIKGLLDFIKEEVEKIK
jgi:heat-inducible transcriptional repressor